MIERSPDGYFIHHNGRSYYLTEQWLDEMWHHQVKHRRAKVDGQLVPGDVEKSYNRLRHAFLTDAPTTRVYELFAEFRDGLTKNRQDRANLGLKALTKDGDEDLRAVSAGAPVRPWNAAKKPQDDKYKDFIRRARETRR